MLIMLSGCGDVLSTPSADELWQIASSGLEYAGKQARDFAETNEYAQQAQQAATQAYDNVKQQATEVSEKAKEQVQKQYQKLKDDAKTEAKNQVNKKIDEAFERL